MPKAPSSTSSASASTSASVTETPFVRRRLLPHQLAALQALFDVSTHPSKEQRSTLAAELGLELKAVNVWYQNKRRSTKKQATIWKPQTGASTGSRKLAHVATVATASSVPAKSSLSLDSIASARERKEKAKRVVRPPLTPKRDRQSQTQTRLRSLSPDPSRLWEFLPSSSPAPPSSPMAESDIFSALPSCSKTMRSLEWACAKDRATRKHHPFGFDDDDVPELEMDDRSAIAGDGGEQTDIEDHEVITPDTSMDMNAYIATPYRVSIRSASGVEEDGSQEDVQAAITLLDFKVCK